MLNSKLFRSKKAQFAKLCEGLLSMLNKQKTSTNLNINKQIKVIDIYREYHYKKRPNYISESFILIKKGKKLIPLEEEATNYFNENGLIASRASNVLYSLQNNTAPRKNFKEFEIVGYLKNLMSRDDVLMYTRFNLGIPDLIVFDPKRKEYFFCEIKSIGDKLSKQQEHWFYKNIIEYNQNIKYVLLRVLPTNKLNILQTHINGLRYHCTPEYIETLKKYDKLILELDSSNPHDKNAIKIIHQLDDKHLGFVPLDFNKKHKIFQKLLNGQINDCYTENIKRNPKNYLNSHSIYINIILKNS